MRPQGKSTENNLGKSRPSDDNDSTCQEIDEAKRALQAAYLWMKHRTNGPEERKYTESIIFCITGEGRIVGWTEAASLLAKKSCCFFWFYIPNNGFSFCSGVQEQKME